MYEVIKIGYTHYWKLKTRPTFKNFKSAVKYIEKILNKYKGIIQYESDNKNPPLITDKLIRFNGIRENGHETFLFEFPPLPKDWQDNKEGYVFNFCKTARKPYDIVVCKCLLILKAFLCNDMILDSDGFSNDKKSFDGTWDEAIKEVKEMGFDVKTRIIPRKGTPYFDCEIADIIPPDLKKKL